MRIVCLAALAFLPSAPARADSWAAPKVSEKFSASGDYFVRVTPGKNLGQAAGFEGAGKGPSATAEFYRREPDKSYQLTGTATLLNPMAPVQAFVSDRGELVTIDNWHNVGYGQVVAVYDRRGRLVKAYTLADLFSPTEIEAFPISTSSLWWHDGPVYINQDQKTLYLMVASGRELVVGLESGRYAFCERREGQYLCRNSNADRKWLPYEQALAAVLAG